MNRPVYIHRDRSPVLPVVKTWPNGSVYEEKPLPFDPKRLPTPRPRKVRVPAPPEAG